MSKKATVTQVVADGWTSAGCTCCSPDMFSVRLSNGETAELLYPRVGDVVYKDDEGFWSRFKD
jgi:hypothetical protein